MQSIQSILQLKEVTIQFGGVVAVSNVSFDIEPGERRAVLGPNGAGKSTLFNLIAGEYKPTSGQVKMFDVDVTHYSLHQRSRMGMGRTYQTASLFPKLTTLDHFYLSVRGRVPNRMSFLRPGRKDKFLAEAHKLAEMVDMTDELNTPIEVLSHGQQRQLEVGLSLAGNPRLILLDEPAAGLSQGERSQLMDLLNSLPREVTVLIIEHDMDIAMQVADIITIMHNGEVIATGSPTEISHNDHIHRLYLGAQQ